MQILTGTAKLKPWMLATLLCNTSAHMYRCLDVPTAQKAQAEAAVRVLVLSRMMARLKCAVLTPMRFRLCCKNGLRTGCGRNSAQVRASCQKGMCG